MTAKHPMIPFPVIVRATDGDIEAVTVSSAPSRRLLRRSPLSSRMS